ncbi:MAG: transposase [Syntrophobacteraceae bacterium]
MVRPEFDRSISIDFQGTKITGDTGFLLMREIDQRFNILSGAASQIDDPRSPRHTDHSLLELLPQRVYQVAAGYEDCSDHLAERGILPCCVSFSTHPVLSHSIRLSPPPSGRRGTGSPTAVRRCV